MRPIGCAALALALLLSGETLAQQAAAAPNAFGLEPGTYSVGFRLLEGEDRSRAVTGGANSAARPRPVRTYLWYPTGGNAARTRAQPMRFRRYAALADEDVWPAEIAGRQRETLTYSQRPLARSLSEAGYEALLEQPVLAVENAEPLDGPFPLIVIGLGFWFESPVSFASWGEYLAARGFVVATTPLVGASSPLVRIDAMGLETEIRDLEFAIASARQLEFVSRDKLGLMGFDMGGMAGLTISMRNPDVDAFMSLESGILFQHETGLPRTSPGYDPLALRIPWMHVSRTIGVRPPLGSTEKSLLETAAYAERYVLLVDGVTHADFTSDALIEGRSAMPPIHWPEPTPRAAESHGPIRQYVVNFFAAFLAQDAESRTFLSRAPEPRLGMTLEHRPAAPASITYQEFVEAVVAGRGAEAVSKVRAAAAVEPNHPLLDRSTLQRLTMSLLFTWGLGKETIPVIELMNERYPLPMGQGLLAEAQILAGDYPAAIEVYTRYLERFPNDPNARARLEWLRTRPRP